MQFQSNFMINKIGLTFCLNYKIRKFFLGFGFSYAPFNKTNIRYKYSNFTYNIFENPENKSKFHMDFYAPVQLKTTIGYKLNTKFHFALACNFSILTNELYGNWYPNTIKLYDEYFIHPGIFLNYLIY